MIGLLEAGARGGLDIDKHSTHILVGNESGLGGLHHPAEAEDGHHDESGSEPFLGNDDGDGTLVTIEHGIEAGIEAGLEAFVLFGQTRIGSHDQRTEGRGECQGVEQRDTHGDGHGESELGIEGAGDATDEAHGYEYRHEDEGGGDQCRGDAMHGSDGSVVGALSAFVELGLYGLYHHDGIIDHGTDDQYEGEEREHVEGEADGIDDGEGGDE